MTNTANQPKGEKSDDGLRVVTDDHGSFRVIDPDGRTSVVIHTAPKDADKPFRVEYWRSTQEIRDADGKCIARTTDPEMAKRICHLLIALKLIEDRKAAGE